MRKIKVLHVTSTPKGIGGVERLLLDMTKHYDFDRFAIAHCNLFDETAGGGPFPEALRTSGLPYFEIAGTRSIHLPHMIGKLGSLIDAQDIDVLHLHMVRGTIVGGLASFLSHRAKVVVSKHYRYSMLSSALPRLLDRFVTNRADAVVAVSRSVEDDLILHGLAAWKARVIHNGIDLSSFDRRCAEGPASTSYGNPGPLVGCIGSLHSLKGQEYLLKAMRDILRSFPAARLLIAGEGAERPRLQQLVETLGIGDAVMMPGFEPKIPAMLRRLDLCVHPAVDEAFGIVLLEAMAARKAVVATNVGGVGEIVADGETGLLVPPCDPDAIARAVCTLLGDPTRRERMGNAGRNRVEREFTVQRTVRSYERLYDELTLGIAS